MGNNSKRVTLFAEICDKLVVLYTFVIFFLFPLYTHNAYYDISISKYRFFVYATVAAGICYLACYLIKFQKPKLSHWKWWDVWYLAFLIFGALSVAYSEYGREAFIGEMGRRTGLFIYLIYAIVLICVVSNGRMHEMSLYFLEASGIVVCGIGILNHYGLDPLHFFWDLAAVQKDYFTSTLGHIDTFGTYAGVLFALSSVLLLKCNRPGKALFHGSAAVISMAAILTNSADGAFIAIFLFFGMGWLLIRKKSEVFWYFLLLFFFGVCAKLVGIGNERIAGTKIVNGFCLLFTTTKISWLLMIGAAVGFFFICIVMWRSSFQSGHRGDAMGKTPRRVSTESTSTPSDLGKAAGKILRIVLCCVLTAGIAGALILFVLANWKPEVLESWFGEKQGLFLELFQITDGWGNNRGYIWRKTINYWSELPLSGKLLGTGPDTSYQVFQTICTESFLTDNGLYYDNAHNEYLQILLTHGILGAVSFFGWIFASILQCLKKAKEQKVFYGIASAVIAYEAMALVGINNISVMAIVFLLICLGKTSNKPRARSDAEKMREEKKEVEKE